MQCRFFYVIVSFLFFALWSCCDEPPAGGVDEPLLQKGDTAVRTLLVYMMAENTLANIASDDINEVKKGAVSVPSDCRLFVFVDDRQNPRIFQFYNRKGIGTQELVCSFPNDFCSSDTAALGGVIGRLLDDYPTVAFDLVLWSHGDGWLPDNARNAAPMRAIGVDNGKNYYSDYTTRTIEIEELAALLEALPVRVDRLMFDACFMQGVEVDYALRNAVEWVIASPAEIPGPGAPYETVVGAFFASDGVKGILDLYKAAYDGEDNGVVLSAAYMPAMQRLADATYSNVIKYFNVDKNRDYIDVFAYLPGGAQGLYCLLPCFYDANAVMKKYLSAVEYDEWKEALNAAVPYVVNNSNWYSAYKNDSISVNEQLCSGISMYMPRKSSRYTALNADFSFTEWYSASGWSAAGW